MTTPIEDGELGAMIQDAVEQAIGQALPNLLDALSDRLGGGGGGGASRVRIDPSQVRQIVDQAISQFQARSPTGESPDNDQTELTSAIVTQIGEALAELDQRTKGRVDRLTEALRQKFAELGHQTPEGEDWREFLSQESRDRRLEANARVRLEERRGPRLQESRESLHEERMSQIELEREKLQHEQQTGDEQTEVLREILEAVRSGGVAGGGGASGGGSGGPPPNTPHGPWQQVDPETGRNLLFDMMGQMQDMGYSEFGRNMPESLYTEEMEDRRQRVEGGESRRMADAATRQGVRDYAMFGELSPEQQERRQFYEQRIAERAKADNLDLNPQWMTQRAGELASRDELKGVEKAIYEAEVQANPESGRREQSYLASRWTNIAGSQAYGIGAYAAEAGIPGLPRFAGQEASMIRAAGSMGTAMTMMGASAAAVVPALIGGTAVIGGLTVAGVAMYQGNGTCPTAGQYRGH